ncbi:MAG: hypothetical protein JKX98_03605 [Alcanivoracaceae bacterium]|nr:hypothetical protein [Alcanivoracaceae bacterium]
MVDKQPLKKMIFDDNTNLSNNIKNKYLQKRITRKIMVKSMKKTWLLSIIAIIGAAMFAYFLGIWIG